MKQGKRTRELFIAVFFLLGLMLCCVSAEAAVSVASDDYALLGRTVHYLSSQWDFKDQSATGDLWDESNLNIRPILWRVMPGTIAAGKAMLMSEYLLANRRYDPHSNVWNSSELKTWLNQTTGGSTWDPSAAINTAYGFLDDRRFTQQEKDAMIDYAWGADATTSKMGLPSEGELNNGGTFGFANNNARIGKFRSISFSTAGTAVHYWTRSPYSGDTTLAWSVFTDGHLFDFYVYGPGVAVRPAFFLNLGSLLFKSASKDFDLAPPLAAEGGGISNPWILVLGGMSPHDASWPVFASAAHEPAGAEIDATGKVLTVSWSGAISPAVYRWPVSTDFTLTRPGNVKSNPVSVTSDDIDDKILILTFANATLRGENVTLGYNLNTDAISYDATNTPVKVADSFVLATANITNNSTVSSGGGTDDSGGAKPSTVTTPTGVSATVDGTKIAAERQPDGTFLITVPHGTDISNLTVSGVLPAGASSAPKLPASHDFTQGPLVLTVTAEDGKTKVTYIVKVLVEEPAGPTEKPLFTINVADCEIVVTQNADGTLSVKVRIPFAASSNPALLDTVKMIASSLGLANVSYGIVNADGSETPVARMAAKAPYLEIRGTAANRDAIENGVVTKIEYTLKGDNGLYAQTFANGGLKLADMPGYPSPEPTPSGGGSSSGCDAGLLSGAGLAAVALAGAVAIDRRRK